MFRPLPDRARHTFGGWRSDDVNYRGCRSRLGAQTRSSSFLNRRAVAAEASVRGLPSPLTAPGVRRTTIISILGIDILRGIPSTAYSGARERGNMSLACAGSGGARRGGGGGSGGTESEKAGSDGGGSNAGGRKHSTFKRLWKEAKHERGHLTMAAVCLLISSSMNLLAPTVVAKVIDRASRRESRGSSSHTKEVCSVMNAMSDRAFFLGAFGVFAVGSLASWGRMYALAMVSGEVAARLRTRLFSALMLQEQEFFDNNTAGQLAPVLAESTVEELEGIFGTRFSMPMSLSYVTSNYQAMLVLIWLVHLCLREFVPESQSKVDRTRRVDGREDVDLSADVFAEKMASILRSLNSSINASLALLSISPSLTLVSISTVPIVGSVSMLYSKHVKRLTLKLRDVDSGAQSFAVARMANMRTVRAFANERLEAERFEEMVQQASTLRTIEASAKGLFRGGLFALTGGALMAVFWVGGSHVGDGSMTAGQLSSFVAYTSMVGLGFAGLASGHADVAKGLASAERVFALLDRVPAVPSNEGITPTERAAGDVEFRDVWFQYEGRDKRVLQGVNLRLSQGKVLALTGVSGAGKSTLASLVTRLYEPKQGCIMLDGTDVATLNPSWLRRQIGVVDQEPVLFDGSIADNIRYGVPAASDEDVQDAARQANAHDFITGFPEGYRTKVGDLGQQLSGGEKQRVAIARAVLKNPPVLVLDEATSALDAESERLVSEAIDRLVTSRTVLVIAHRQSTISKADCVAILQDGVVAETGAYDELMSRPGSLLSDLMKGGAVGGQ